MKTDRSKTKKNTKNSKTKQNEEKKEKTKKVLDDVSAFTGFAAEHIAIVKFSWQASMGTLPVS